MNEVRAKRVALSTVLFLIAGLMSVVITAAAAPAAAAPAPDPGTYQALTPARILDTRTGNGAPTAPVAPAATLDVTVLGVGGIPSSGVSAVVFNLTDTGPTTYGFITAYPAGQALPLASSINFSAGETRAHLVVVAPGTGGQVALYNGSAAPVDMVADVAGYYTAGTPVAGGEFAPLTPARILDTRTGNGAPQAPLDGFGSGVPVQVAGRGGVPSSGAASVIINLTATRPSAFGYLTIANVSTSSVNFHGGQSVSNLVVVPLQPDGSIVVTDGQKHGHVDVVADVVGYFVGGPPSSAGRFGGLTPVRLLDTRATHTPIPAQASIDVTVAGLNHVPAADMTAAVLNVTVAGATTSGYLATYPTGMSRPTSSTVNFDHNTVANLVLAPLGPDGKIRIYNSSSAPVQVVIDVSGYVGPVPGPLTWSPRAPIPGGASLTGVACGSPTFCMAFDSVAGLSYRYDGHAWSSITDPGLPLITRASCVASGFCMAFGADGPYRFDGTQWSSVPFPDWPSGGTTAVSSVSCVTATFCVAAGLNGSVPAAAVYDGSQWTENDPGLTTGANRHLISCASTTFCLLVDAGGQTARFDGAHWTILPAWTGKDGTDALSCATATFCELTTYDAKAVINDGSRWGSPTSIDVQADRTDNPSTVACTSSTFCLASTDFGYQLVYDGTSWSKAFELDPGAGDQTSIACAKPSFCLVVDAAGYFTGSLA